VPSLRPRFGTPEIISGHPRHSSFAPTVGIFVAGYRPRLRPYIEAGNLPYSYGNRSIWRSISAFRPDASWRTLLAPALHSSTRVPSIRHASRWASASANLRSHLLSLTREARPRRGWSLRAAGWLRVSLTLNRLPRWLNVSAPVTEWQWTTTSPLAKTNECPRGARSTRATPWR